MSIETLLVALLGFQIGLPLIHLADTLPHLSGEEAAKDGVIVTSRWRSVALPLVHMLAWGIVTQRAMSLSLWGKGILLLHTSILLLVLVIDLETRLIPNILIVPAAAIALLLAPFDPRLTVGSAAIGGVAGFLTFFALAIVTRGGFGMGDAKLALYIGLVSGHPAVWQALLYGIFLGGITALLLLLFRLATRKTYMPYGPFLCLGAWLTLLLNID